MDSAIDSFITLAEIAFFGFVAVVCLMLALFVAGWGWQAAREVKAWVTRRKAEGFGRRARRAVARSARRA